MTAFTDGPSLDDPCASCPDGPRTKGGACDNTKGKWLCDRHFVSYAKAHASCGICWTPAGGLKKPQPPTNILPNTLPNGNRRGWK